MTDLEKSIEAFKTIQADLNKEPVVMLDFNGIEKQVKFKKRMTGFIVDNAIKIIRAKDITTMESIMPDFTEQARKHFKKDVPITDMYGKETTQDLTSKELLEFAKKYTHKIYKADEIKDYIIRFGKPDKYIDTYAKEQDYKMNIELFKIFIDDLKYIDGEETKSYTTEEIALLHSDYKSDFWKSQIGREITIAVNFFRGQNSI